MLPSSTVENYLKAIHHGQSSLPKGQRLLPMGHVAAALSVTWAGVEMADGARRLVVDRVAVSVPFTHRWRIVEPTSTPAETTVNAGAASGSEMTASIQVPTSDSESWVRVRLFNDSGESVDQVLLLEAG